MQCPTRFSDTQLPIYVSERKWNQYYTVHIINIVPQSRPSVPITLSLFMLKKKRNQYWHISDFAYTWTLLCQYMIM